MTGTLRTYVDARRTFMQRRVTALAESVAHGMDGEEQPCEQRGPGARHAAGHHGDARRRAQQIALLNQMAQAATRAGTTAAARHPQPQRDFLEKAGDRSVLETSSIVER